MKMLLVVMKLSVNNMYWGCKHSKQFIFPVFGKINAEDIVSFMKQNQMTYARLQLQLHKYIWDPEKRGV